MCTCSSIHSLYLRRGLHTTPLPAMMSADIALASVYTRSASFRSSSLQANTTSGRKLSDSGLTSPLRRPTLTSVNSSRQQQDGSDSDEGRHGVASKPEAVPLSRRRTQSFLPIGNPLPRQKRKMSGPELQSIDEAGAKAVAAAANSNARTFRPAYM